MGLYQEIIFLQTFYNGKFCVENVVPYYAPLIPKQAWSAYVLDKLSFAKRMVLDKRQA